MADEAKEDAAVQTAGGGYVENEDHVPNPTDMYGTFNTSGTGAHHDPATVSPIFEVDRKAFAERVVAALDPDDDSVPADAVLLSEPQAVVSADHDAERDALKEKAQAYLDKGPVEVGGPTHLDEEAAKEGDEGAAAANARTNVTASDSGAYTGSSQDSPNKADDGKDDDKPAAKKTAAKQTTAKKA